MRKKDKNQSFMVFVAFIAFINVLGVFIGGIASGKDIEKKHTAEYAPIRSLMFIISSHTSNILDAIMMGDYDSVKKEAYIVVEKSESLLKSFFPEGEPVGKWMGSAGISGLDQNNPKMVQAVKEDVEKYVLRITTSARKIAEISTKQNIAETYNSFDLMLRDACFKCHETYRSKWPEWPEWMQIGGG